MYSQRSLARDCLNGASQTNYWELVKEAKISKEDMAILKSRFVDGMSNDDLATEYGYSVRTINRIIARAYDKVYSLIKIE